MISWRWPRPIAVIASIALMPVCSASFTGWRAITFGACSSSSRKPSFSISPRPSIGLPSGSTTRPRNASPTGTESTRPVRLTCWPSSMPGEVAEDHDADLAHVEVQRHAERAVLELEQLVGHASRADPRRGRCRRRRRRRYRPPRGRSPACTTRRSARARRGSRRRRWSARPSATSLYRQGGQNRSGSGSGVQSRLGPRAAPGVGEPAQHGAVVEVATDPDPDAAEDRRARR